MNATFDVDARTPPGTFRNIPWLRLRSTQELVSELGMSFQQASITARTNAKNSIDR